MIDIKLATGFSRFTDSFLSLAFTADEEDFFTFTSEFSEEVCCDVDLFNGFFEVENMDLVAGFQDEGFHFWVPAFGLVSKVDSCFDEFCEYF